MKVKCPKCGGSDLSVVYRETTEYTFTVQDFRSEKIIAIEDAMGTFDPVIKHVQCLDCSALWASEKDFINELS